MSLTIMNLVTPKAGAKHELLFNEMAFGFYSFNLALKGAQGKGV
jgi:hypothetical protein